MKAKATGGDFTPCPEYTGRAVCVDVTPLKKVQSDYGERDVFRFAFEVDENRDDGSRWCVWSSGFTLTIGEKSNLRKFLRGWMGRDFTAEELKDGFDVEAMLHKPAFVVVTHTEKDGKVYANIASCTPYKGNDPLPPSGKFVRAVDREKNGGKGGGQPGPDDKDSTYRRTTPPPEESRPTNEADTHLQCKVHVGRFKGTELRELSTEALGSLHDKWVPAAEAAAAQGAKLTADDKRLVAALKWWKREQTGSAVSAVSVGDDVPF